jgi:hypothetical protein
MRETIDPRKSADDAARLLNVSPRSVELSRELEKAQTVRTADGASLQHRIPDSRNSKTKRQALADAGIPTSTAHRYENLRRARAIEAYVRARDAKAEAMRAMRVLETAVGVALGPAELTQAGPGRGKPSRACEGFTVPKDDRHRFRLMAERREAWWRELAEIHLRACVRIGELSRELERAEPGGAGGGSKIPPVGISKTQALADAGVPTSTAHRYEELAGGREQQAQAAGRAAMNWPPASQ